MQLMSFTFVVLMRIIFWVYQYYLGLSRTTFEEIFLSQDGVGKECKTWALDGIHNPWYANVYHHLITNSLFLCHIMFEAMNGGNNYSILNGSSKAKDYFCHLLFQESWVIFTLCAGLYKGHARLEGNEHVYSKPREMEILTFLKISFTFHSIPLK